MPALLQPAPWLTSKGQKFQGWARTKVRREPCGWTKIQNKRSFANMWKLPKRPVGCFPFSYLCR